MRLSNWASEKLARFIYPLGLGSLERTGGNWGGQDGIQAYQMDNYILQAHMMNVRLLVGASKQVRPNPYEIETGHNLNFTAMYLFDTEHTAHAAISPLFKNGDAINLPAYSVTHYIFKAGREIR